jgi:pseudouridine synthase
VTVRLNKFLADRGVAARRKCDALIAEGRVRVNGEVVTEAGTKVEEQRDRVSVDGKPVAGRSRLAYFVLNKPVGVITTLDDPQGRRTVGELLPRGARVYPVNRLNADTSGLLLLTNDGELAHRLMHPRSGVPKVYEGLLEGRLGEEALRRLREGVELEDGTTRPARVDVLHRGRTATLVRIEISEGRNRQIRRMGEAVGHPVIRLSRVRYDGLDLGSLAPGEWRELSPEEMSRLGEVVGLRR